MPLPSNLVAPTASITRSHREARNGHRGVAILLTGLPASGKSTLAQGLQAALFEQGRQTLVLDGDTLRGGLNRDLGFSDKDRLENIRRASELAALLVDNGQIVILAMIAPLTDLRAVFAERLGDDYREVWCSASLAVCESRDPKGHYARARNGELPGFTGIGSPYEPPPLASLVLDTGVLSVQQGVERLLAWLAPELDSGYSSSQEPTMESPVHSLPSLFKQLGLPDDPVSINQFVTAHSPLKPDLKLAEAFFWTDSQKAFLREEILDDADWAEVVDELNLMLRDGRGV